MRRVLVLSAVIGGMWLLVMAGMLSNARGEEPTQWFFFNANRHLFRMSSDGKNLVMLADKIVSDIDISLSRNMMVVSARDQESTDSDLSEVNFAGNRFQPLLSTPEVDRFVRWLPNSPRFIFESLSWDGIPSLYAYDIESSEIITLLPNNFDMQIKMWLPDEQSMIIQARNLPGCDIFKVNFNLTSQNLTNHPYCDIPSAITPDGDWLIFERSQAGSDIYRVQLDGLNAQQLTWNDGYDHFWTLIPDGNWIIFSANVDDVVDIYRMHIDGSVIQQLTNDTAEERFQGMSADNEWMIYGSDQELESQLYRSLIDGTERQYIDRTAYLEWIDWSPDRKWIIYQSQSTQTTESTFRSYSFATNQSYQLGIRGYDYFWSPENQWIYFVVGESGKRVLRRTLLDGSHSESLLEVPKDFWFLTWAPIIDLEWNAHLLAIIGFAMIGGSLCGGYWFSRR